MLQRCFDNNFNEIQIGVDEAGRGSLQALYLQVLLFLIQILSMKN